MRLYFLIYLLLMLATGCDNFPKDPDKTLEKINKGTLRVGYSENAPWVIKTAKEPSGLEADLVRGFAKEQNARIVWVNDTEQDLFQKLEKKELHLVIGGLTDKNLWKSKISFTRPYLEIKKDKHVMAILKGENAFTIALETYLHQQESLLNTRLQPNEAHR